MSDYPKPLLSYFPDNNGTLAVLITNIIILTITDISNIIILTITIIILITIIISTIIQVAGFTAKFGDSPGPSLSLPDQIKENCQEEGYDMVRTHPCLTIAKYFEACTM